MKKAIVTIEVLISMLILFLITSTSFEAIKFFNIISEKKVNYEDEYITVLSIKDKISSDVCNSSLTLEGILNGYKYQASCKKLQELRNYKKAITEDELSGNIGSYFIGLYNVSLVLNKGSYEKKYEYIVEKQYKKRFNL